MGNLKPKGKHHILNSIVDKAFEDNSLCLGDCPVSITVDDIYRKIPVGIEKNTISKTLKDLKEKNIIDFNGEKRKKTREVKLKNIISYSTSHNNESQLSRSNKLDIINKYFDFFYSENNNLTECFEQILSNKNPQQNIILILSNNENHNYFNTKNHSKITLKLKKEVSDKVEIKEKSMEKSMEKSIEQPENSGCESMEKSIDWILSVMEGRDANLWKNPQIYGKIHRINFQGLLIYILSTSSSIENRIEKKEIEIVNRPWKKNSNDSNLTLNGENQMSKEIINIISNSVKENKKQNKKPTKIKNWEDLSSCKKEDKKTSKGLTRRKYNTMPFSFFKTKQWHNYYSFLYSKILSKQYSEKIGFSQSCLLNKVYPLVFEDLKWSAKDFASFTEDMIMEVKNKKRRDFKISYFNNLEKVTEVVYNYNEKLEEKRINDIFSKIIYIPHIPLLNEKEDLMEILSLNENEYGLMYNYGICVFHRFLQGRSTGEYPQGMTVDEATAYISALLENLKKNLIDTRPDALERYISETAKNTLMLEPYTEKPDSRNARVLVDWRKEFRPFLNGDMMDLTDSPWWRDEPNYSMTVNNAIRGLFITKKRKSKNKIYV